MTRMTGTAWQVRAGGGRRVRYQPSKGRGQRGMAERAVASRAGTPAGGPPLLSPRTSPYPDAPWASCHAARAQQSPHIVEVYGLNRNVTTTHLEQWLQDFHWAGIPPSVRWVDDEHCLVVFPSAEGAQNLLDAQVGSKFKARPFAQASRAAYDVPYEGGPPQRSASMSGCQHSAAWLVHTHQHRLLRLVRPHAPAPGHGGPYTHQHVICCLACTLCECVARDIAVSNTPARGSLAWPQN